MRVIIITGTPGVGKTTVATELAKSLSSNVLDVSELVQKENIVLMPDDRRETLIADMKKLRTRVKGILARTKDSIVIEGHYAYDVVPKSANTTTFVLRRDPDDLEQKLRKRGYDDRKTSENIAAEVLDVCLIGAIRRLGKDHLHEIDVTHSDVGTVVNEILEVLNEKRKPTSCRVDWIAKLEAEGRLENFLSSIIRVEGVEYGHLTEDSET